ncbi:NUDIX hydrolase [Yoonia sp. BS5-3]|uniref:NUDIX hydrolase n=1 Tax=Yoonia phaeophyticola TaxID=3137369 RepID=A0ABZ2V4P8_9RHOB
MDTTPPHNGAKVALFLGDQLVSILRDDLPHIPHPNRWDLPGGGRERGESPFETMAREVQEELGLIIPAEAVLWERAFSSASVPTTWNAFFVAQMPAAAAADIVFGDEGQRWALFTYDAFIALPDVLHYYPDRLALWIKETGGLPAPPNF